MALLLLLPSQFLTLKNITLPIQHPQLLENRHHLSFPFPRLSRTSSPLPPSPLLYSKAILCLQIWAEINCRRGLLLQLRRLNLLLPNDLSSNLSDSFNRKESAGSSLLLEEEAVAVVNPMRTTTQRLMNSSALLLSFHPLLLLRVQQPLHFLGT